MSDGYYDELDQEGHETCDGCGSDLCCGEGCECDAEDFEPGL